MRIYDFEIKADEKTLENMGLGSDPIYRCRTNNDGSGLFVGSGNTQLLDNGHHPTLRQIRAEIRGLLIRRWQDNSREYCDEPKFRMVLVQK